MKSLVIAAATLLCLISTGAAVSASSPIDWQGNLELVKINMDTAEPPDGLPHSFNNTHGGTLDRPCAWNDEDEVGLLGQGNLGAGATAEGSLCMVADKDCCNPADYPKFVYARVYVKPTANLKIWATLDGPVMLPDGRVVFDTIDAFAPPFIVDWGSGSAQEYQLCGPDAVATTAHKVAWSELTYWPIVPGSGGYGLQVSYTLHVQNLDKQPARNIRAYFEIGWNDWDKTDSYEPVIQQHIPPDVPCPNIP